jgi:DNA-binding Xre family transcriptional regulator
MTTAKIRTSQLRASRHMTQAALAQKAQLSKTTISNLESGHQTKIALDTIAKLCQAFECSPAELFELQDNDNEKVVKSQRDALKPFIGSLKYNKPFKASELDSDLAMITNAKKARIQE